MATMSSSHDNTSRSTPVIGIIALTLLVIGGLNWGLVGLFNLDLVAALLGPNSVPSRVVYALVGLSALFALTLYPRLTRR